MNKKILAAAACTLFLFPFSVRADWMESAEARFFTEGGTSAARISLSSEQFLKVSVSPAEDTASFYFLYGDMADEDAFALQLPCLTQTSGAVKNALISVTPVINTDNGKRFYIIDTGAPGGCLVVSYSGGKFKTAFDASSVPGDWTSASIEVQKKDLILHLSDAAGTTQDHVLVYDKKAGTFTAEDSAVSTIVIQ